MGFFEFFDKFGRALSRPQIRGVETLLKSAGLAIKPEVFAGFFFSACIVLAIALSLFLFTIPQVRGAAGATASALSLPRDPGILFILLSIASALLAIVCIFLLLYSYLSFLTESRRRLVDSVLPDFLVLASANIRAGMSMDQALWQAAKPEFGIFSNEVEASAKRTFAGEPFDSSLDTLASRFDSRLLKRTVSLIKQSMSTGGKTAEVLEETAKDARNMQIIGKEISSSLLMYVIFVVFAAVLGAPFLLAVSHNLLSVLSQVFARMPPTPPTQGFSMLSLSKPPFTPDDFFLFSIGVIICTSLVSALIIGTIQKGSKWQGAKYIPFLIGFSLITFFAVKQALSGLLPGTA